MENNQYWKGLEELNNDPQFVQYKKNEFAEGLPLDEVLNENDMGLSANRRDFLKFFGFSISAVALAACTKTPVKNAIPYLVKPEEITPGVANWYASTCGVCASGCGVLVKTREGRPIKLEGNEQSPISKGGLCATGHASLLSLYDNERFAHAQKNGKDIDWKTLDTEVASLLAGSNGIRVVTSTINSPSTNTAIAEFLAKYPKAKQVTYDSISYTGILLANEKSFGKRIIPAYNFEKAEVIVSFGADFLETWISPVEYTKQWVTNRRPTEENPKMSRHYQFESLMTLTGSNADYRVPMKESMEGIYLVSLYNYLAQKAGVTQLPLAASGELAGNMIKKAADDLWNAKGKSLVISKSNDVNVQTVVNGINTLLGNYGNTIDLDNYSLQAKGIDSDFETLVEEMENGTADAVIFYNVNPAYTYRNRSRFAAALKKTKLSVSTASAMDETAKQVTYIAPDNHFLESWNDTEGRIGMYSLTQPTIAPVFETRQAQETFLAWAGNNTDFYTYVKNNWSKMHSASGSLSGFESFWQQTLHDGVYTAAQKTAQPAAFSANLNEAVAAIGQNKTSKDSLELILYASGAIKDGGMANNPWLQEMPDPISKVTWDNYASISKLNADALGIKEGDLVNVKAGNTVIEKLPVVIQPGQARNTVGIALGYGRTVTGQVGTGVGIDVFHVANYSNGGVSFNIPNISLEKASGYYELAQTQTHHTIEGRDIIREAPLAEYVKNPAVRNEKHAHIISLWDDKLFETKGHKWAMSIDLNACTGCGSCIVSCSAENNVPVVGRDEVRTRREMHWIRIDRYYRFKPNEASDERNGSGYTKEKVYDHFSGEDFENVSVTYMPMLCQQCGHAPCETVCPVLATTHSSEGLNQMTYNRCVGTRYCANNCPYKVRRFNWFRYNDNDEFNYYMNNDLGKMVINPDVTVRTRGVMEKCSFCVQRIQEGKLTAKREGRQLKDGDIKTACSQSCPANAIVFGDLNDPESEISKLYRNKRSYVVLEEINVQPSIYYMTKIRNTDEKIS